MEQITIKASISGQSGLKVGDGREQAVAGHGAKHAGGLGRKCRCQTVAHVKYTTMMSMSRTLWCFWLFHTGLVKSIFRVEAWRWGGALFVFFLATDARSNTESLNKAWWNNLCSSELESNRAFRALEPKNDSWQNTAVLFFPRRASGTFAAFAIAFD